MACGPILLAPDDRASHRLPQPPCHEFVETRAECIRILSVDPSFPMTHPEAMTVCVLQPDRPKAQIP